VGEDQERQVINYLLLNMYYMVEIIRKETNKKTKHSFKTAALALGISIVADALDYLAAPLFSIPIIGDVFDVITTGMLYSITRSKVLVIMNLAEFIPFVGDFLPVYTVSTLIWILREYGYESFFKKLLALISNKP
jgi:hypothetical protein